MTWLVILFIVVAVLIIARIAFAPEIKACFERDPAARSLVEVLLTYSGLHAIICHRFAHALDRWRIPVAPRLIMSVARWLTGIEIHPSATIGRGLFIDHGAGVVIGETAVIGDRVTLFQGVTLGGTGKERGRRHPTVGDNVVIGAGAKVLGNITIGKDSMIGANAVVIRDVPEHSTVVGVPGRITRTKDRHFPGINLDHTHLPDPLTERLERLQHEIDQIEHHLKEHRKSSANQ
ncbi:MAG: serine O-acetyltransferase [Candidatus Omnitrophica bacterium]|nr:serine O-acetyltransferase [Candidatus Omnitrophota bacterium]MBI3021241.1 serine O-acetyltransferase [Candidatus Omnitrophota bacterium]MBI3083969.1 serine O-acetyltransferase [Candidatus Omnitrophota bacterium]